MCDLTDDLKSVRSGGTFYTVHVPEDSIDQLAATAPVGPGGAQFIKIGEDVFDGLFNFSQEFALVMVHGKIVNRKS